MAFSPNPMELKEVRAIVRPSRLERVREALRALPEFPGITVVRATGFTAPAAVSKRTIRDELTDYSDKVLLSVLCKAAQVEAIRDTIFEQASTGAVGDGIVWVVPVDALYRIRDRAAMNA